MDDFLAALAAHDLRPPQIIADGKIHRFSASDDKADDAGWYVLTVEGDLAHGGFGDHRRGLSEGWSSLVGKKITAAEKQRMADIQKKARAAALKDEKKRNADCQKKAEAIWAEASEITAHEYITRKKIKPYGAKQHQGKIVLPIYNDGALQSVQQIAPNGDKKFLFGTKKVGSYLQLGDVGDRVLICEGWATACSLHEATACAVIVAWDAYNLVPVARIIKKLYSDAVIIIAADNDYGNAGNVGVKYAQLAAEAVGGAQVRIPCLDDGEQPERTSLDYNDVHCIAGLDALRDAISPPQMPVDNHAVADNHDFDNYHSAPDDVGDTRSENKHFSGDLGMNFRVLGYNNGNFYYFPFSSKQILCLSAGSHSINNLMQLDTLKAWESGHRDSSGKLKQHSQIAMESADKLMTLARQRGVFQAEDRVRGVGTWIDEGRVVLHCGDVLYVDGEKMQLDEINSYYMYIASVRLMRPAEKALGDQEAARLRKICESITWENPMSGSLLAGWLVIAPICSALAWRPHVWLTGEAGSGKSTTLNKIIKPVLGRLGHYVDGKTTEPSIREQMGYNARPLVFDEAEPSGSIDRVLDLARAASSGSRIDVFGKAPFVARFCACFSAINPPVKKAADETRICFMVIKKNRRPTAQEEYNRLLSDIDEVITEGFAERLLARTLANMDSLIANIRIFSAAFRAVTKDARSADQVAPMLAGLYLLGRTGRIAEDRAIEWVSRYDWGDHSTIHQISDPLKLVQYIAESLVRSSTSTGTIEMSLGDLIEKAHVENDSQAERVLGYYGIKVKDSRVYIASSSHNLAKVLKDTEWGVKWSRTLGDVPGAEKAKSEYFSRGVRTSAVSLPIALFLTREEDHEPMEF